MLSLTRSSAYFLYPCMARVYARVRALTTSILTRDWCWSCGVCTSVLWWNFEWYFSRALSWCRVLNLIRCGVVIELMGYESRFARSDQAAISESNESKICRAGWAGRDREKATLFSGERNNANKEKKVSAHRAEASAWSLHATRNADLQQ